MSVCVWNLAIRNINCGGFNVSRYIARYMYYPTGQGGSLAGRHPAGRDPSLVGGILPGGKVVYLAGGMPPGGKVVYFSRRIFCEQIERKGILLITSIQPLFKSALLPVCHSVTLSALISNKSCIPLREVFSFLFWVSCRVSRCRSISTLSMPKNSADMGVLMLIDVSIDIKITGWMVLVELDVLWRVQKSECTKLQVIL